MMEIALPSPIQLKLAKAKEKRRLEIMRDEKEVGGWWEKGVWVDGEHGGKGAARWVELEYEGVEWEGAGDEVTMADTSWW
jgi:glutamate synthase domain-containing protein 2